MRRIHLIVEYDGTNYAGWQRQDNAMTVQESLETALTRLTGEIRCVHGASRTDAGVHALGQSAHFDTESRIPPDKFAFALNTLLPGDIRVTRSEEVSGDFHARFSSKGKRYRYLMHVSPHAGALNRLTHAHVIYPLDEAVMRIEAQSLVGTHDFAAFAASGSVVKDTVRTIYRTDVARNGSEIMLTIEGSGFLYNMVRIIAGTLLSVGKGKLSPEDIPALFEGRCRADSGMTAPPQGLFLEKIWYDGYGFAPQDGVPAHITERIE